MNTHATPVIDKIAETRADLAPYLVELHLTTDPDLPKKYGKAIKAVNGEYSEARGTSHLHRFVTLPSTEHELINKLVVEFGFHHFDGPTRTVTMIARHGRHSTVVYVPKSAPVPMDMFEYRTVRTILWRREKGYESYAITNAEVAAEQAFADAAARVAAYKHAVTQLLDVARPTTFVEFDGLVETLAVAIELTQNVHATALYERMQTARATFMAQFPEAVALEPENAS